ncbi:MAG TPA: hypothetical protein VNS10_16875 [Gemmatimonadaceae bacterium]|jgi:hypothetical protein|nr:hypothetical protein [Gemmatimonadaceae bacterium]
MTSPFVASLRARRSTIHVAPEGTDTITIRVEMPEVWDVVRIVAAPSQPVVEVKLRAIEALCPEVEFQQELVLKLRGWEVLDENASLAEAGVVDGSILLMTYRRRRPVR